MYKNIRSFIIITLLFSQLATFAAGSIGSEITYKSTSTSGVYEVTLVIYRSCNDLALCSGTCGAPCTQTLNLMGGDSGYITTSFGSITLSLQNVRDISNNIQNCASAKNTCTNRGCATPGTFDVGYERYEFTGLANIGATSGIPSNCCNVRFVHNTCCRNAVQTISTSNWSDPVYQEAVVNRCFSVGINNSSPVFTNDPLYVTCGGEYIIYNNGLVDPDGDSLSFAFAPALTAYNTSVTYLAPFTFNRPIAWTGSADAEFPGGIRCDPVLGDVMFTAGNSGGVNFNGIMVIKCDQWRKIDGIYKLLGTIRRECALTVLANCPPNNSPRFITNPPNGNNPNAPKTLFEMMAGHQLCFTITAKDTDVSLPTVSDTTVLTWNQSLAKYGATFLPVYSGTRAVSGPREDTYQFCWTPPDSVASTMPHSFIVTTADQRCPSNGKTSRAFLVKVAGNPHLLITQKNPICNKVTLQYVQTNSQPVNVNFTSLIIGNDTGDRSLTGNITAISTPPGVPFTYMFSKPGKYFIGYTSFVGASGLVIKQVLDSVEILSSDLQDSISVSSATCHGLQNATINAFAKKGTAPYQYKFNTDSVFRLTSTFGGLAAGNYSLTVKDAKGCLVTDTIVVSQPDLLQSSLLFSKNVCDTFGLLNASASGGTAQYLYSFNKNTFQSSASFPIHVSGKYNVVIKDSNNCEHQDSILISLPVSLKQTLHFTKNACDSFGLLITQPSGGVGSYSYRFNQNLFQTTPSFNILQSGNYTVALKDSNNCVQTDSIRITIPSPFKFSFLKTEISCFDAKDGRMVLNAQGGNAGADYRYSQFPNPSSNVTGVFTKLDSGLYEFTIMDDSNCTLKQTERWVNPAPVNLTFIGGNSTVLLNQTLTYLAHHDSSIKAYTWNVTKGSIVSGQGTDNVTVKWNDVGTGLIEVEGTNANQCKAVVSKSITIGSVGMNELQLALGISIFPNPTKNVLSISIQNLPENNLLSLYDLQGKLMIQQELKLTQQLNLQELPQGIYILKVGDWHGKIVKN